MNIQTIEPNNQTIAIVRGEALLIADVQSALDLIATVRYETGGDRIVLYQEAVHPDFFELKTRLAGEVLQKFINYGAKLAIVGDFSVYDSKSLRDFIYESNQGKDIFFVSCEEEAIARLAHV